MALLVVIEVGMRLLVDHTNRLASVCIRHEQAGLTLSVSRNGLKDFGPIRAQRGSHSIRLLLSNLGHLKKRKW